MTIKEMLVSLMEGASIEDQVAIVNEYFEATNNASHIYYMGEFNDVMEGLSPMEVVEAIDKGFNSNDDYFWFDGLGYACSSDLPMESKDCPAYWTDIAGWIADCLETNHLYPDKLNEFIDNMMEAVDDGSGELYAVKEEYYDNWDCTETTCIVSDARIHGLADEWGTSFETLLEQVEHIDGIK